jgi:uncharacterized Zn finger protein
MANVSCPCCRATEDQTRVVRSQSSDGEWTYSEACDSCGATWHTTDNELGDEG